MTVDKSDYEEMIDEHVAWATEALLEEDVDDADETKPDLLHAAGRQAHAVLDGHWWFDPKNEEADSAFYGALIDHSEASSDLLEGWNAGLSGTPMPDALRKMASLAVRVDVQDRTLERAVRALEDPEPRRTVTC